MVYVCDAIMGSGKSSAGINFMNRNGSSKRFIYVTPFHDETNRIKEACPDLKFSLPSSSIPEYEFRKGDHLKSLLADKKNIAITHSLFSLSDAETIRMIVEGKYTVIIDEAIEVFKEVNSRASNDLEILIDAGWLTEGESIAENGEVFKYYDKAKEKQYYAGVFQDLLLAGRNSRLIKFNEGEREGSGRSSLWFWSAYKELFESPEELYILTYMFEHSSMRCFMDIHNLKYKTIGVRKNDSGEYEFAEYNIYPDWVKRIPELINVFENKKLNEIGKHKTALSSNWVKSESKKGESSKLNQLRKHLDNYFRKYMEDIPAEQRLWSTFKRGVPKLRSKGFYNSDLSFNSRAINDYGNKRALAYCVNIFQNPCMMHYYKANGVSYSEDGFALSTMLQWIWRSAVRNGEPINIYIPSRRMRELLGEWITTIRKELQ